MKKVLALITALMMVIVMCVPALAVTDGGSIKIDHAVDGKEYKIYRVFDLELDTATNPSAYKYTLNKAWNDLKNNETFKQYFTVDDTDSHLEKKGAYTEEAAATFATALKTFLEEHTQISCNKTTTASSGAAVFDDLPLGYYFVTSEVGSLCFLDTTNSTVTITEKNQEPTIEKKILEGTDESDASDGNIGDTVKFETTVNVYDGSPEGYVIHDKMSSGLTFDSTSVVVRINEYDINTGSDYTLTTSDHSDGCTFEVTILKSLNTNDVITVTYSATINNNATVGGDGNANETYLEYTDTNDCTKKTETDTTKTYTWEIPIYKYTVKNGTETPLSGAKFELYKEVTEGINTTNKYATMDKDGRITGWVDTEASGTKVESGTNGNVSIKGLDTGTYYLKETDAPAGYNKLTNVVKIEITLEEGTSDSTKLTSSLKKDGEALSTGTNTIKVLNSTGSELPSTGGIGTTIFYVIGGILVIGAAVALIVRKRMSGYEE